MHPSRATLATTGLLISLLVACTERSVVPTEPSRVAPTPSIPGSSSATVRTGLEAERYLEETAAAWSRKGDDALSQYLEAQKALSVGPSQRGASRGNGLSPSRPSLVVIDGEGPSPTTTPNATIYYTSTVPYVSGSSATIVSSVTYYGNLATSDIYYSAVADDGGAVIPQATAHNRGLGVHATCLGSMWECSWTFKLQTVVSLNLGRDCGVTVTARADHRVEWTYPAFSRLPGATWGTEFSGDAAASARNDPCAPRQTCTQAGATNYGGPAPCTFPPPPTSPTGGDGSTPPSTGTTQPPTYEPAPFVPSGHWECNIYFIGTDYEREYCTWYADYTRLPKTSPAFALSATDAASRTQLATELPSVFVIVSDQVPADAMAVIERHKQGPYKNVLLIPSSTIRPAVLVAALQALADSRGAQGETPNKDLQLTLKGGILDQQIPAAARDYAASFTALIATAKRGQAGAYGLRPMLELRLADRR